MKQILYGLLIIFIVKNSVQAQSVDAPQVQSPNVSSLGEYGKVPVSYYTGVPDISVPLYSVKTGNLNLPISLRYHPGSVKPNEHPGWVGLGWTLDSYGVISRVRHGEVDEGDYSLSYIYDGGDWAVNNLSWNSDDFIKSCFTYPSYKAVQADEFFFNFFGHSGKFMYSNGKWQVFSEENIKVIFDPVNVGFVEGLVGILDNCTYNFSHNWWTETGPEGDLNHFFKGFTLITEDGTKYIFGGTDNSIEYTTTYNNDLGGTTDNNQIMASAWYLTKAIDVNNNEIDFSYTRTDYPICALGYYNMHGLSGCDFGWWSGPSFQITSSFINTKIHGGYVIFPVYLNQITTSDEILQFNISSSSEKQYTSKYLFCPDDSYGNEKYTFFWLKDYLSEGINAVFDDILWMKLNSININYKSGENYKNFIFSYDNYSTERLRLSSITETDKNNVAGQTYSFNYDNSQLPDYGGDQTDHWGYFNGKTIENQTITDDNYFDYKQTDPWYVTFSLLKSIVYPTGGRTEFTWQSNSYSKVVAPDRGSLLDVSATPLHYYGGGVRIKQISSYATSSSTTPLLSKSYYYVLNYAGDDINNYTNSNSSGILNGIPQYNIPNLERTTIGGQGTCYGSFFSTNGLSSYGYNANGSPVGYSEVTVMNKDGSYTRYLYTNYVDYDGTEHFDQPAVHVTGWANGDIYAPSTSKELERGKLLQELNYNSNKNLVKKTEYSYTTDNDRFNKYTKRILSTQNQITTSNTDALIFTASFKDYYYRYNLMSKTQTIYDPNGNNGVTTTESYTYNNYDQMKSVTQTQSDGSVLTTEYKYPKDYYSCPYSINPSIKQLVDKNILNAEIEKISSITKGSDKYIVGARFTKYGLFNNNIKPQTVYSFNSATPILYSSYNGWNISSNSTGNIILYTAYNNNISPQSTSLLVNTNNCILFSPSTLNYNFSDINGAMKLQIDNLYSYLSTNGTTSGSISIPQFSLTDPRNYTFTLSYNSSTNQGYGGSWNSSYAVYSSNKEISINSALNPEITLNYDDNGNIINVQKTNNINLSYIWGYNHTYQIAKFYNSAYSTIIANTTLMGYINQLETYTDLTDLVDRNKLKTTNTNIRSNLPANVLVTTYTYSPLKGMTSKTDAKGVTTYYVYDTFGRLFQVLDQNSHVLKQYDYHYYNQ